MSDLEATSSQVHRPAQITDLAHSKLRALRSGGLEIDEGESMLNAFAEVFARMAASSPAPVQESAPKQERAIREVKDGESSQTDHQEKDGESTEAESIDAPDLSIDPVIAESDSNAITGSAAEQEEQLTVGPDVAIRQEQSDLPVESELQPEAKIVGPAATQVDTTDDASLAEDLTQAAFVSETSDVRRTDRHDVTNTPVAEEAEVVQPADEHKTVKDSQSFELETSVVNVDAESDAGEDSSDRSRRRAANKQHTDPDRPASGPAVQNHVEKPAANPLDTTVGSVGEEGLRNVPPPATHTTSPEQRQAAVTAITGAPPATPPGVLTQSATQNTGLAKQSPSNVNTAVDSLKPVTADTKSKSTDAAKNPTSEAVDRAKLIQRVSKAFQHLGPEGGVVRLRLAPAELGTVRVEMRIHQRKIDARVVAETEAASAALRENLPDLRRRLESFGMQIESIEVETDSSETNLGGRFENPSRGDGWHDPQRGPNFDKPIRRDRRGVSRSVSQDVAVSSAPTVTHTASGVDLKL